jgi:xylan 1,4-beta-xylosidase
MRKILVQVFIAAALIIVTVRTFSQELSPTDARRAALARLDGIPHADQGNGYYRNPILVGPGADNSIVRVDKDFYMIAGGEHLIWHSRDLVNWRPVTKAFSGGTWASDINYHDGKYYIYTTLYNPRLVKPENRNLTGSQVSLLGAESKDTGDPSFDNIVIWADNPAGPWSEPIHLGVYGLFDPGLIVDQQGDCYLYFNKGIMIQLKPDGLGTIGDIKKVYGGWDYPDQWVLECHCLEAPKLTYHKGYYYMASAEGGTSGPSTAHMAVMARSKSAAGPWENSPYNPVIRTENHNERWWRQGHGTLIDDAKGNWWFFYTGYENGFTYLGKQSLMLPVEWTEDGWPRVIPGIGPEDLLPMPPGENVGHGMPLSDDFTNSKIGIQWSYRIQGNPDEIFHTGNGQLKMTESGNSSSGGTSLSIMPVNHAYEVEVDVTIPKTAEGGIMLGDVKVGLRNEEAFAYWPRVPNAIPWTGERIFVRIRNDCGDISCYYSKDGQKWSQYGNSTSVTGSRSVSLYAAGEGDVIFRNFKYRGLD